MDNSSSYVDIFTRIPLVNLLALFLLTLCRVAPIVIYAPFLGGRVLPGQAKMGFVISLSLLLIPFLAPMSAKDLVIGFPLIPLFAKEIIIGFIIGFLVSVPFSVASSAGSIIDHQRGSASLMITDPSTSTQTSPIGLLLNELLLVSFFFIGGLHLFFETLIVSFQRIPPETYLASASFTTSAFWEMVIRLMHVIMSLSVRFAAPPLIAMLMADIFLGIANRLAPQVQIAFLGMPLKSLLGLIVLFIGFYFIMHQMEKELLLWLKTVYQWFLVFPIPLKS